MKDFDIKVPTAADVPAIVDLANAYTYQNLSLQERQSGFLTGVFSEAAISAMIASAPCIIAYQQQGLAGFILNTNLPPGKYPPLVQEIIIQLPQLNYQNLPVTHYNYFFYGPVLVAKNYRRQGLLQNMFQKTKEELKTRFNLGIAFIDQANKASHQVHTESLGWEVIGEITFNNHIYSLLAFFLT
ncbi:GNAT family N-acetyltransferase [Adhaeribacter radiodurans]|uniref:GNAT family N-acetyltransferase n=1 Tax=Adhaeribacter radiodurans TaxID=2745197 RepID=A0A7L7L7W1_9BACT|nr:hypothetical protein [Adhaeribacter radiodurans]QMU28887.1 hypothetical protein HUW48_12930 [Adhaeribacter radiodurans]